MAEGTRDPAAASGEVADNATSGAALLVTFYGRRNGEQIHELHERLYQLLGPEPREAEVPRVLPPNSDGITGLYFDPPGDGPHDTTVLQLALNSPEDAAGNTAGAWEELRGRLDDVLNTGDLDGMDDIWGYTLVYQAVLKDGSDPEKVLTELLPAVRRLHSSEGPGLMLPAGVPGGWAWLLGIPDRGDGPDAGMVYAALASEGGERELIGQFYSMSVKSVAELLEPDLIAHKGYHQMRQYRGKHRERRYEERLGNLQETTDLLLKDLQNTDYLVEDLEEGGEGSSILEALFQLYCRLLPAVSALKGLQVGMLQQAENLEKWLSKAPYNEALEYHQDQLKVAIRELELKVEPLQSDLEIADKLVSTARLQMDKEQEDRRRETEKREEQQRRKDEKKEDLEQRRQEKVRLKQEKDEARNQQRMQTWLAAGAAALTGVELVDREVAGLLLGRIPILESFEGSTLAEFGAQLVVIAVFAALIYLLVRRLLNRRRDFTTRSAGKTDERFLWQMLAELAYEPTVQDVKANPVVAKYVEGWDGDYDDLGFVAESSDGELLGAAWQRLFTSEDKGFGYVDDQTPELVMAVLPEHRYGGIGAELLERLLYEAARRSYPAVSLSVSTDNPALRLYKREGFEVVEGSETINRAGGSSVTMRAVLDRVAPQAYVTAGSGTSSHGTPAGPAKAVTPRPDGPRSSKQ